MRSSAVVLSLVLAACGGANTGTGDDAGTGDDGVDGGGDVDGGTDPNLCTGGTLCGIPLACCEAGNECVNDQCVAACATQIYCGANLDVCCNAGEVCLGNACVEPGAACQDSYDCEPGFFCEPTLM